MKKMYGKCMKMKIDESEEVIDLSDHCFIEDDVKTTSRRITKGQEWKEETYYSSKEQKMQAYKLQKRS